ncbi:hypothetical protein CPB83DRAFT_774781 [Crepidotus variabilis]|uniref:BTB domain-containing protein n=1 Tax=Crepidotus variabilis TaxID=179855 RepID=A0A9P6E7A4_9AGAR|nr:hypothetical protein CPB83DRAFT_774781 [Crepidotus variabilis]
MRFTTAIPHPSFCFSDGTVVFEVENTLFKVHKFFFLRHSEFFRTLLGSRPAVAPPNIAHFKLNDVKKQDFERLLYVFYPTSLTSPDLTTVNDWTSVLTLAHKWQIQELKLLAIQKLGPLASPIDKIALARNFNLASFQVNTVNVKQDWLLPAFTELCSKNSPLSLTQAEKLDMPTVVKIWEVQHEVMNWPGAYYGPQIMNLVKEKFDLE